MRIPAARAVLRGGGQLAVPQPPNQAWNEAWLASRARSAATSAEPTARSGCGDARQSGLWTTDSAYDRLQLSSGCPSRARWASGSSALALRAHRRPGHKLLEGCWPGWHNLVSVEQLAGGVAGLERRGERVEPTDPRR